jgi:hypothetical protein
MYKLSRRIAAFVIAMLIFIPSAAFAADGDTGEPAAADKALSIDNDNKYAGMDKTYGQGYMPKISGGKAYIVLPLVPNDPAKIKDPIKVTPNFGDAASSPFVFNNMEKTVPLVPCAVTDKNGAPATVSAYLVSLDLKLDKDRVNGRYPLTLTVDYKNAAGAQAEQTFTVYVTIKDGKKPESSSGSSSSEPKPQPQPKVIVSDYEVSPNPVVAGEEFNLSLTLKNTSEKQKVQNIKVNFKGETTDFISAESSNTVYLKSIAKKKTDTIDFKMKVRLNAEPKPQKVIVTIEYEDSKATAITATEEVAVEIKQPNRISYDKPNFPTTVNAGDTIPINMNVFNMGKSTLNNVMCALEAPGLIPEGSAFLGNMESGASKTAEMYVFVGTKDMSQTDEGDITTNGSDESAKYGATSGVIHLSYEDEFGQKFNEDIEISTSINPPVIPETKEEPKEEKPKASQWWISVIIAALLIAAAVITAGVIRNKRKKKVALDEAD